MPGRPLQVGDVIEIGKGDNVFVTAGCVPKHPPYDKWWDRLQQDTRIGYIIEIDEQTDYFSGRYVVIYTGKDPGAAWTDLEPTDFVTCEKLDGSGVKVRFFISESGYKAAIEDREPVGRAKCVWVEEQEQ